MMGLAWCRGHVRATLCYGRGVAMACLVGWIRQSSWSRSHPSPLAVKGRPELMHHSGPTLP